MLNYILLIALVIGFSFVAWGVINDATLKLAESIFENSQGETEYEDFSAKFVTVKDGSEE